MPRYLKLNSQDKVQGTNSNCTLYLSDSIKDGANVKLLYFSMPNSWVTMNASTKRYYAGITGVGIVVQEFVLAQNCTFVDFLTAVEQFFLSNGCNVTVTYSSLTNKISFKNNNAFGMVLTPYSDEANNQYNFYDLLGMTAETTVAAGATAVFGVLQYVCTLSHSVNILIKEFDNSMMSSNSQILATYSVLNNSNSGELLQYNCMQYPQITKCNKNTSQLTISVIHPEFNTTLTNLQNWEMLLEIE